MRMFMFTLVAIACIGLVSTVQAEDELKLSTGDKAPDFQATTLDGETVTMDSFKDAEVLVVVFTCNSCPVAVNYEDRLIKFADKYKEKGVTMVAINNSRSEDLEAMRKRAEEKGFNFVYAYEGSGKSAKAYGAKVTPHCFVLNEDREVVYQGAFDNSQQNPTEHYVIDAVNATLMDEEVEVTHKKAFGCGIKFRRSDSE